MMRIADAAARVGVPTHRLRHYEATGLLVPDRTPAGYRLYSAGDVDRGKQIKALLEVGFTANDVALMLPCMGPEPEDEPMCCPVTRSKLTARLEQIRERRALLQRTEHALGEWLELPNTNDLTLEASKPLTS